MTYRKLREIMMGWTNFELDCDLTVKDVKTDECYAAVVEWGHDSLDEGHPVFSFVRGKGDSGE